jgi:hypothetical protein
VDWTGGVCVARRSRNLGAGKQVTKHRTRRHGIIIKTHGRQYWQECIKLG